MGSNKEILLSMTRRLHRVGDNADITGGLVNIFTIANFSIRVIGLIAHVTTAGTGGCTVLVRFTPTGGGAVSDFCAVSACTTWPINTLLTYNGQGTDALGATVGIGHAASGVEMWLGGASLCPGVLSMTTGANDATLVIDWYLSYKVGALGAVVTAN